MRGPDTFEGRATPETILHTLPNMVCYAMYTILILLSYCVYVNGQKKVDNGCYSSLYVDELPHSLSHLEAIGNWGPIICRRL